MAGDEVDLGQGHVRRAAAAANLGNHAEAAREYEAAYMKTSDASLLVLVGQAWQAAGDPQKALTAFRSYVRVAPNGDQRFLCEGKIREIEDQGMARPAAAPLPGPMAPPVMVAAPPSAPPPLPSAAPVPYPAFPPPATSFQNNQAGAAAVAESSPFYAHWPFWAALGAAVAGGVVAGILWARQDTDLAMPTTTFGAKHY